MSVQPPGRIDEDPPHDPRRQREDVHAIVPVDVFGVDQTDIDLMDERRGQRLRGNSTVGGDTKRLGT